MPTGYTAGILDGKITTFPQFAKQCMRAFGATIHMRDDDMDAEYQKRTPGNYHKECIEEAKKTLVEIKTLSDETIIAKEKKSLETDIQNLIKHSEKIKKDAEKLNAILKDVKAWKPPTSEHEGIKKFMISQISETIGYDCTDSYTKQLLKETESKLKTLNAKSIREEMIAKAKSDLAYHTKELKEEMKRCKDSNKWVSKLLNSLPQQKKK